MNGMQGHKHLEKQLRVDLNTGEITDVNVQPGITIKQYFSSLSILNRSAHIYGVVYLATDEALELLK